MIIRRSLLPRRLSYALAVLLLLLGAGMRLHHMTRLPAGLNTAEISDIRIAEAARTGNIQVFYDLGGEGREGLYHALTAALTSIIGGGLMGYRFLSVASGMLSLALVYALVQRLYNPLAALAALGLLSVTLWPVMLSRLAMRETLLPLAVSAVLLALAHGLAVPRSQRMLMTSTSPFAALGILLGLSLYVHPIGFMLILGVMAFIVYMIITRQPLSRRRLGFIAFAIVVLIVISTPYLISSLRLPELSGTNRVFDDIDQVKLRTITSSLGGFFLIGDANPTFNLPGRPFIDLISGLFMCLGLVVCLLYWRRPRFMLPVIVLLPLLAVSLLSRDAPNFTAFSTLIPFVGLFFGLGVSALTASLGRRGLPLMALVLVGLLVFNTQWLRRDLFFDWPGLPEVETAYETRLARLANYLDLTAGDIPSVICSAGLNSSGESLLPYELLTLMVHRQTAPLRYVDCGSGLVFTSGGEREQVILPEPETLFNAHRYVREWLQNGQLLRDGVPEQSVILMNIGTEVADRVGRFTTTAPTLFEVQGPSAEEITFPPISMEGNLTFLGYEPTDVEVFHPGDYVTVISYWRVDGPLASDLVTFTHVLFDPETIAAQRDTLSVLPSQLRPRDVFVQITFFPLPRTLRDGTYRISIGVYQAESRDRLRFLDDGQPRGTRLFLDEITVDDGEE